LTLSSTEFHNAAVVSSLSDILEIGDVPQRYFLSAKACRGMIRRINRLSDTRNGGMAMGDRFRVLILSMERNGEVTNGTQEAM